MDIVTRIERLFRDHGDAVVRRAGHEEPLALARHALQCAYIAETGGLGAHLVAAALLHDVGHLLAARSEVATNAEPATHVGAAFLAQAFEAEVVEPVRLQDQALRYLVTVDALYPLWLTAGTMAALQDMGDAFAPHELRRFESLPFALDAVTLRRVVDAGMRSGQRTPPLVHYLALLDRLLRTAPRPGARLGGRRSTCADARPPTVML